jgi:hypothetical protein
MSEQANKTDSLDAATTFQFEVGARWRGASDFDRWVN